MLPRGWTPYRLGDLMTFRNGLNYTRTDRGEVIKIVGVADFQARSTLEDTSGLETVTVKGKVGEHDLLQSGDLLFVRSNGNKALIGRCLYFPSVTEKLSFSGFTIRGRADSRKLNPEFASYLLRAEHIAAQMHVGGSGTNISNLSQEILNGIQVSIPGLDEQIFITDTLRTWDEAIATTSKLLANSRRQKRILAVRLLRARADWLEATFNDMFRIMNCKEAQIASSAYQTQGRTPVVDQGQKFIAGYTDDDSINIIAPPMIVFGDHTRIVKWIDFPFRPGGDGTRLLLPNPGIHPKFAYHLLANASIPNLGYSRHMSFVKRLRFALPADRAKQAMIAEHLDKADKLSAAIETQVTKLVVEKRALMNDLLTGKRRARFSTPDEAARAT